MSILDRLRERLDGLYQKPAWVQRIANSDKTIASCGGVAGNDDETGCCFLCVGANRCFFANEPDKMPIYPQHINCHCKLQKAEPPTEEKLCMDFSMKKIKEYALVHQSKKALFEEMGYTMANAKELYDEILDQAREQYLKGNYHVRAHTQYGVSINIVICLVNFEKEKVYRFYSGWTVYPEYRLKNNTPFGGWVQ